MTLSEFLTARIAEDEGVAQDALAADIATVAHEHMARWNPDRVLTECKAKGRIVALHSVADEGYIGWFGEDESGPDGLACTTCGTATEYAVQWPCETLRILALPDADHEDYLPEWTPEP